MKLRLLAVTLILVLLTSAVATAQTPEVKKVVFNNKYALANLTHGIHSENMEIQKQCIYYCGLYKVDNLYNDLKQILFETENETILRITVLSMLRINEAETIKLLKNNRFTLISEICKKTN